MSAISKAKQIHEKQIQNISLVGLESTYNNEQVWSNIDSLPPLKDGTPRKRPSFATIAFRRLAFGAKAGDIATFRALGESEQICLRNYIERQLHPKSIDDEECSTILSNHPHWNLYRQSAWQLWQTCTHETAGWEAHMQPLEATEHLTFLRAIHSRRQLFEKMVSFWRDHFYIYGRAYGIAPLIPDFDLAVLRTHTLGNFRQLLYAVATSPAMLLAYQNNQNRVQNIDETWARMLLANFTIGPQFNFGNQRSTHIPTDQDGQPVGFSDDDVRAAARCFSGWISHDGRFRYSHDWHDAGGKWIMDLYIPPGQGHRQDGENIIEWLATHPKTAYHISEKLCRFILGNPPQQLIQSTTQIFLKHKDSSDQIRQVLRHIIYTRQFITTWGARQPSYFDQAITVIRTLGLSIPLTPEDEATKTFLFHFRLNEQALFSGEHITQPTPELFFPLARWLLGEQNQQTIQTLLQENPAGIRTANQLAHYWSQRLLGTPLPPDIHESLAQIIAPDQQGDHPLSREPDHWFGRQTLFRLRLALAKIINHSLFYQA